MLSVRKYVQNSFIDIVKKSTFYAVSYDKDNKMDVNITKPVAPSSIRTKDVAMSFSLIEASRRSFVSAVSGWDFVLSIRFPLEVDIDEFVGNICKGISVTKEQGFDGVLLFMPVKMNINEPTNNTASEGGTELEILISCVKAKT